ncbi:ATP-binding cassette domain-containing protein [Kitasatospora sp. NPDC057500]|uniref:ATP-binding cassette domain-containing protein n=1 Tax=Kitasatospora sp. NPDC057500 TaxID=3346151 RepID=UPI0036C3EDDA
METAIRAEGLRKRFKGHQALDGVDLSVAQGTVLGLLGPNGAGKTTTVRMLSTLLEPDGGHAEVAGFDVVRRPEEVRRRIGLAGQYAAVDGLLTGRENLTLIGVLLHLGRHGARRRAGELLDQFNLVGAADRPVQTYSGGMRRRLDLAACLVASPSVLFLDEPTTGLDPVSRTALWNAVRDLVADGVTVLLTTQYLEEADFLADRIAVVDAGRVVAEGTPDELKRSVGPDRLEIRVAGPGAVAEALEALRTNAPDDLAVNGEEGTIVLPLGAGMGSIAAAATALEKAGVSVVDFAVRRPTLDDAFARITGQQS